MSVIVTVRKDGRTAMAADSLTSFGDAQRIPQANATSCKMRRIGDAIVGSAGWGVYDNILDDFLTDRPAPALGSEQEIFSFFLELWKALHERYSMVNDQAQAKESPFGDLDSSFLIAHEAGVFFVSADMAVTRFEQYAAIGWGAEYALGAVHNLYDRDMNASEIARRAVETAICFNVHCGGAVHVFEPSIPEA